ncbi:MAG: hypothetical protein M3R24_15660, partial [Chloroflexota bacterium]|nr:hypothetical protein [Chloroflexota bacterium]
MYFNIWQIKQTKPEDFKKVLIGCSAKDEENLRKVKTPFDFSVIQERTILRFLRLIECDEAKIGMYAKLVDDRNKSAHSNGNIFCSEEKAFDRKVAEILRSVKEIQTYFIPIIRDCYNSFLLNSCVPDEREYIDDKDQLREVLVHSNYLSQSDIEICLKYKISNLSDH